jgi:hypothetical protein
MSFYFLPINAVAELAIGANQLWISMVRFACPSVF